MYIASRFEENLDLKHIVQSRSDRYPIAIKHCQDISPLEKEVFLTLLDHMQTWDGWTECRPSHGRIASLVNCSRRTVVTAMGNLKRKGFIDWRHGDRFGAKIDRTNIYYLTDKILDFHPDKNAKILPFRKKSEPAIPDHNNGEIIAHECISIILDNIHLSDDKIGQDFKNIKITEEKERVSEKEKEEAIFLDSLRLSPMTERPKPTLEVAEHHSVDSPEMKTERQAPSWLLKSGDGKDPIAFRNGIDIEARKETDTVYSAFVSAMAKKGHSAPQLFAFEYKQAANMIREIGVTDAVALMSYSVENWDLLMSEPASKSDAIKFANSPIPNFNIITAHWRWRMWRARMTGKVSERTRKKRERQAAKNSNLSPDHADLIAKMFQGWLKRG